MQEELGKLSLAPIRSGSTTTRILSKSEARHWLSDADTQWQLFPNRHVICDVGIVVYRLVQENFDRILKRHLVVATEELGANGTTVCGTLSFGCCFEIPIGFQCSDRQRASATCSVTLQSTLPMQRFCKLRRRSC